MQEKEVKEIADWIIAGLVSRGVTISEAVKALRMADRRIQKCLRKRIGLP